MAMNSTALASLIEAKLQAAGFDTQNQHSDIQALCTAVAEAVVEHIHATATANVSSGSSSGSWPVT
ncbi:hypothetical protein GP5015_1641 [gamma proteobacterium HTCC5015]|nr:hypothetical protein GP5015_1641 [gamma proteobacterium HTCC5015]